MIQINKKEECCGCSACYNACSHNAIAFAPDEEGFNYPKVNKDSCIDCGLCEKVCPIICRDNKTNRTSSYKKIYACRLKDEDILHKSSSGGAFPAIAIPVLERGGVVVGATYTPTMEVAHLVIESPADLVKLQGSKYVQSNLNNVFRDIRVFLKSGRLVLFSGTPCQVDGLKHFLIKDYPNLVTVDIVCHAVASPKVFWDYVRYAEKQHGDKMKWINMRDKEKRGWQHLYSQRFLFENKGSVIDSTKVIGWNYIYFSQFINRPSCYECRYANLDRPGDFSISDLWDDNNTIPSFKDPRGASMMMLNTDKAVDLFKNINFLIEFCEISIETALQPNLQRPTPAREDRDVFWNYYNKYGFSKSYKHFFKKKLTLKSFAKKVINYIKIHTA